MATWLKHWRFGFWFLLAIVNGVATCVCLHVGVVNWMSLAFFLISFCMATHYSSIRS